MLTPKDNFLYESVVKNWTSDFMGEIRQPLKECIYCFIHNCEISVRNISSSIFALIFALEIHPLNEDWLLIFQNLVNEFSNNEVPDFSKHGILSFFHEIMILPIFPEMKKLNDLFFIPNEFKRLLDQLIQNLNNPESNPKPIFDFSILTILDLVHYVPIIFQSETQVNLLLESYLHALPKADPRQYQQLFEVLLEIISNSYDHVSSILPTVFDYSHKGIVCPNSELARISTEFWVEICRYEKKKGRQSREYSKTAMGLLRGSLIGLLHQDDDFDPAKKASVDLIRKFSDLYPGEMLELYLPVVRECLYNDGDLREVLVSLYLIQGLCSKRSPNFSVMVQFFDRVCFVIRNSIGYLDGNELMSRLAFHSIWAANRIVRVCDKISSDRRTFDFVLELLDLDIRNVGLTFSVKSLSIALFKSSQPSVIDEYFNRFFDRLFYGIDDLGDDELDIHIASLRQLYQSVPCRSRNIIDSYPNLRRSLEFYIKKFSDSSNSGEMKILRILELINTCIEKSSKTDFKTYLEDLVDTMTTIPGHYSDLTLESIINIFASLCRVFKGEFAAQSQKVIEAIKFGFRSQSPSIIESSMILCGDFMTFVSQEHVELIVDMFDTYDSLDGYLRQNRIMPVFIKSFAVMYYKIDIGSEGFFEWDESYIERFYNIVVPILNSPNLSKSSKYNRNFDPYFNARVFESCFWAMAAFFKNCRVTHLNLNRAKREVVPRIIDCFHTKAYDASTLLAVSEFLVCVVDKFRSDISMSVNKADIKEMLLDEEAISNIENKNDEKQYRAKFHKTIEIIENTGIKPIYEDNCL